ncbi:MAG: SMI1/KNR4 family protein [Desulfobulbus sp.]|nr:SMI1/KNR4 family protein [Desulfobulbus sp.]
MINKELRGVMSLRAIYEYFADYRKDNSEFFVVSCKGVQPTEKDLTDFENEIGFRLPDEFREFTKSYLGGMYMEVKEELWPRPKEGDVGPFWSFLYALKVFGIAEGIPDWLDLRSQYREFSAEFEVSGLVPFLQIQGNADRYCFDQSGRILEYFHDDIEFPREVAQTFSELLLEEIKELEDRKEQKKEQLRRS